AVAPPLVHASIAVVTAAAIALLPHASLSPPTLSLPRRRCQPAPAAPRGPARQICPDPSPAAPHPPAPRVPPSPRSRGEGWGEGLAQAPIFPSSLRRGRLLGIDLGALLQEGLRLLLHSRPRVVADLLGDLHRAEFRAAHRAEMRELGPFGGQGLVVELLGRLGVERQ